VGQPHVLAVKTFGFVCFGQPDKNDRNVTFTRSLYCRLQQRFVFPFIQVISGVIRKIRLKRTKTIQSIVEKSRIDKRTARPW